MRKLQNYNLPLEYWSTIHSLGAFVFLLLFFTSSALTLTAASPVKFSGAKAFGDGGSYYYGLQSGDFNGDGKLDVLTCSYLTVLVFYGDNSGEFVSPPVTAYTVDYQDICPVVGDFNNDGRSDFAISDRDPVNNQTSTAVSFGNANRTISQPVYSNLGVVPRYLVSIDFDNDGKLDLVGQAQVPGHAAIISYKGNGSGGFTLSGQLYTTYEARDVKTGDFNGDSLPDIAYGDSDKLQVSKNLGGGSFAPPVTVDSIDYGFSSKIIADINNDGKQDVAAVQNRFFNPVVAVWLGNGNFVFTQAPDFVVPSNEGVYLGKIADLNYDQKPDLIFSSLNRTIVINGLADGTFTQTVSYIDGGGGDVVVEDFNADNRLDIAANQSVEFRVAGSGSFSILLNLYDGGFLSAPAINLGDDIADTAVADFNDDQLKDFVVVKQGGGGGPGDVIIVTQSSARNFSDPNSLSRQFLGGNAGLDPRSVVTGDYNQDGKKDIVVVGHGAYGAAQNVLILLNLGNSNFASTLFQIGTVDIYDVVTADLNSDGKLDLITSGYLGIAVSFGAGNGTFSAPVKYFNGIAGSQIVTGDFNNDSQVDAAVVLYNNQKIGILMNTGTGAFIGSTNVTPVRIPSAIAIADMNSDGKADLIASKSNGISVLTGFGNGTFNTESSYEITPISAVKLSVADFNGDGKADVAALAGSNSISVLLNNGAGGLNRETVWGGGATLTCIAADDFNNDQKTDLIFGFTSSSTGYVKILFNLTESQSSTQHSPFDFDGDGKADISVFRPENGSWYIQQSTAGFTGLAFGLSTDKLVPADYDGDGKTDVAVYRGGTWYLKRSQLGFTGIQFGANEDIPIPADYDGDGKADLAVFRPSTGVWYLQRSQLGFAGIQFGQNGDKPVAADYDGDGNTDIAVNRAGNWYIQRSRLGFTGVLFGDVNDKTVPADYDGDGKADIAVFRPSNGTWYLLQSQAGFTGIAFGLGTDIPVAADYDGDGKTDLAVVRNGNWYLNRTTNGFTGIQFGTSNDLPIPGVFVR